MRDGFADAGATARSDGARIIDRGYQHYTGERRGAANALRAVALGTMRRALGFKRPATAKILPFILVLAAFAPGLVAVGIRMLFPDRVLRRLSSPDQLLRYPSYFGLLSVLILVLTAVAAPEALCPDRRQRVLALYYASPIRPFMYLLGQVIAVTAVLLLVTLLPPLLLWGANVLLADDAMTYLRDNADQALRIIASGGLLAAFYASLGLAVASYTERKAYAAVTLLGGSLLLSTITDIVRGVVHASWSKYAALLDPIGLPIRTTRWLFGLTPEPSISGWLYLGAALVVFAVASAAIVRAYREVRF